MQSVYKTFCQQLKDVTYKESIQSYTPIMNYEFVPDEETRGIIDKALGRQVEDIMHKMVGCSFNNQVFETAELVKPEPNSGFRYLI